MVSHVGGKFETMDYAPGPESAKQAQEWLDAHDRRFGMFIDSAWTEPAEDRLFDSVNPASGQPIAQITQASAAEVDAAVAAAWRALRGWSRPPGPVAARFLHVLAPPMQKHAPKLAGVL